jgi:hypothetical protein
VKRDSVDSPAHAPPLVQRVLASPGAPLPAAARERFEGAYGHSFANVRVHCDEQAADSAQAVGARAYTVGRHIVFGRGQDAGGRTLAHELAHVAQQGERAAPGGAIPIGARGSASEREAHGAAHAVMNGGAPGALSPAPLQLSRDLPPFPATNLIPRLHRPGEDWDAFPSMNRARPARDAAAKGAADGARDAAKGDSLDLLDKRVFFSHWGSDAERLGYVRGFLRGYARRATNAEPDADELELRVYDYEQRIRAHDEQLRAEAKAAAERDAAEREAAAKAAAHKQLVEAVEQMLVAERLQRFPGRVEVRNYSVLAFHAAVGERLGPIVEIVIKFVPYVGEAVMLIEAILGKELYTDRDLGTGERIFNGLLSLIPVAGQILSAGKAGVPAIAAIASEARLSAEETVKLLEALEHLDPRAVKIAQQALRGGKALSTAEREVLETALRTLEDSGAARAGAEEAGGVAGTLKRTHKPTVTHDASLPAGEGATDAYGNIRVSPYGTATEKALVLAHEKVHSWLSPRMLNRFRRFRAVLRMKAYKKLAICQYLEEMLAETVAQVKVNGLSVGSVLEGIKFPITNGYVTLGRTVTEAVIGTIVYGGIVYGVYVTVND